VFPVAFGIQSGAIVAGTGHISRPNRLRNTILDLNAPTQCSMKGANGIPKWRSQLEGPIVQPNWTLNETLKAEALVAGRLTLITVLIPSHRGAAPSPE
jgi:hypothetical protein